MSRETSQADQDRYEKVRRWRPSILIYLIVMNSILLCLLFPTLAYYFYREAKDFQNVHLDRMVYQMRHDLKHRSSA